MYKNTVENYYLYQVVFRHTRTDRFVSTNAGYVWWWFGTTRTRSVATIIMAVSRNIFFEKSSRRDISIRETESAVRSAIYTTECASFNNVTAQRDSSSIDQTVR
jgi:hypothetical protein